MPNTKAALSIVGRPTKAALTTRAHQVEARLKELYLTVKRSFIETGHLIVEAEDRDLWKQLKTEDGQPYNSFDHWVRVALPYGRSTALQARDVVRKFDGVPDDTLEAIPRTNLVTLAKLPPVKRKSPKWLNQALTLPAKELKSEIHLVAPSSVPTTPGHRVTFNMGSKSFKAMSRAFEEAAKELGDPDSSREECLTAVCLVYLAQRAGRAGKRGPQRLTRAA